MCLFFYRNRLKLFFYLAIIQLLNNFFVFFTNVAHTDEFGFSVAFKKLLTDPLYNSSS